MRWSYHLWHHGWTPLSEFQPDWMIQPPPRALTGLRAVPLCPYRQAAVLTCVTHVCPAALAPLQRVPKTECGREGSVPSPTREQQFCGGTGTRLFLDDLPLWVLMVGLVSSNSWHIRLMRLNLWYLIHLWTQIVLAFVLTTDHTMLTSLINFALYSKGIFTFSWPWNPFSSILMRLVL